jgi:hypothetical protein
MYSPKLPVIVVALLCSQVGRGAIDLLAECGEQPHAALATFFADGTGYLAFFL